MRRYLSKLAVACAAAVALCLAGGVPAEAKSSVDDILWFNPASGEVTVWVQNGAGGVKRAQSLSWRCTAVSGCSSAWKPIGTGNFNADADTSTDLLWFNPTTGEVSAWLLDWHATVIGTQSLSWRCTAASGCSADWKPIGTGYVNADSYPDVVWFNPTSGVVSAWLLNSSGTVTGTQTMSARCSAASGCSSAWKPVAVADFDISGQVDVLWHNAGTGELSAWMLSGTGTVTQTRTLTWRCAASNGCSRYQVVGAGDFSHDGYSDVLWRNLDTGDLAAWILDGTGTVLGAQPISWGCTVARACTPASMVAGIGDVLDD
jgi:hypothetical protein